MVAEDRQPHLVALDLLRAGAALVVMLGHLRGGVWLDYGSLTTQGPLAFAFFFATRLAHEAVMVFFVLSGFLVGGKVIERVRAGRFSLFDYGVDRIARIFPPLLAAIALTLFVTVVVVGDTDEFGPLLASAFALNGVLATTPEHNAPLWSIAFEVWFYVIAGAVGYLAAGGRRRLAAAFVLALCAAVFWRLESAQYVLFWGFGAVSIFLLGMRRQGLAFATGLLLMAVGLVFYQLGTETGHGHALPALPAPLCEAMICIGLCAALPYLCNRAGRFLRAIAGPVQFVSGFSYSLYLTHRPMAVWMEHNVPRASAVDLATIGVYLARIAVCLVVALVFYYALERNTPAIRSLIKARFGRAPSRRAKSAAKPPLEAGAPPAQPPVRD